MVEEAYRSNAGIVGPKVVDRDQPDVLVEVGMAVDHYGVPFSGLEPGEVDQEQHDGVRDVFFVSHTAMLVRADLCQELGGFDALTDPGADDIDLCWRARLAGARVIVAPAARVREGTSLDAERAARHQPPAELRSEVRSRVRLLCKSYSSPVVWQEHARSCRVGSRRSPTRVTSDVRAPARSGSGASTTATCAT
jgi:GT2 family glycosyltransferase